MFKQIVHPIYRISQLNVLYSILSKKHAQYTALVSKLSLKLKADNLMNSLFIDS